MRKLQRLSTAVVLALMLANGAFAGIIGSMPDAPPPPSATAPGIIDTPPSAQSVAVPSNPVVDVVLTLIQTALSVR